MKKLALLLILLFTFSCDDDPISKPQESYETGIERFLKRTPEFELNRSGIAPLAVSIDLDVNLSSDYEITIIGDQDGRVQKGTLNKGEFTTVDFIGLFPDSLNMIEMTFIAVDGGFFKDTFEIQTDPLPEFFPEIEIITNQGIQEPGWNLCVFNLGNDGVFYTYPYAFDNYGNVRWYFDLSFTEGNQSPFEKTQDGNLLFGIGNNIWEYDWAGNKLIEVTLEEGWIHHDIIKLPNGNYVAAVNWPDSEVIDSDGELTSTVEDHMVEVSPAGTILTKWNMADYLDVDRYDIVENRPDWFHMNSMAYDHTDNTLIVSGRHQGLVKVDFEGNLVWIMTPHKNMGQAGWNGEGLDTREYLLKAIDLGNNVLAEDYQNGDMPHPDFEWSWGQHDPEVLPNGNILIFDNGVNRDMGAIPMEANYSRSVEYEVDNSNMTVKQIRQYGKDRGPSHFSFIVSSVSRLEQTGNYYFSPGISNNFTTHNVVEYNPFTNEVYFEALTTFKDLYGTGEFAGGQFDLIYRTIRIDI